MRSSTPLSSSSTISGSATRSPTADARFSISIGSRRTPLSMMLSCGIATTSSAFDERWTTPQSASRRRATSTSGAAGKTNRRMSGWPGMWRAFTLVTGWLSEPAFLDTLRRAPSATRMVARCSDGVGSRSPSQRSRGTRCSISSGDSQISTQIPWTSFVFFEERMTRKRTPEDRARSEEIGRRLRHRVARIEAELAEKAQARERSRRRRLFGFR